MAVYSGFFNAVGHDRMYNAIHFSWFFDGLIKDGVYVNWPDKDDNGNPVAEENRGMYPSLPGGRVVNIAPGRAWFNRVWIYNDAVKAFTLDNVLNTLVSRIDAIVIDVNNGDDARIADIVLIKGTEAAAPDKPTLIHNGTRNQYPLCYVTVNGNGQISDIERCIRTGECPSVEALLEYSSFTKAELQEQIDAKTFPNLANALGIEQTEIDSDNDYIISQKVSNNTPGAYVRKKWSSVVSWLRKKFSSEKGIMYDVNTGKFKLTLRSETRLENASAKATEVAGRAYPIELDKDGYPCVMVPWTDDKTNDKVTQSIASDNKNFRVLFSFTDSDNTLTEGAKKDSTFTYNPSTDTLNVGTINPTNVIPVSKGGTGTSDGTLNGVKLGKSGNNYGYYVGSTFKTFRQPTGNAGTGDVLSGKTFANANGDAYTGTMTNRGAVSQTINPGGSYTIPAGYHNGSGKVTANPNQNSGTYTYGSGSTGGTVDMGANNTYRYVNASNVYNKGKSDGQGSVRNTSVCTNINNTHYSGPRDMSLSLSAGGYWIVAVSEARYHLNSGHDSGLGCSITAGSNATVLKSFYSGFNCYEGGTNNAESSLCIALVYLTSPGTVSIHWTGYGGASWSSLHLEP